MTGEPIVNHEGLILAELSRLSGAVGGCEARLLGLSAEVKELRSDVRGLQAPEVQAQVPGRRPGRDAALASVGGAAGLILWSLAAKLAELFAGRL